MASQINPGNAPEDTSSQETSSQETAPEADPPCRFRASRFYRWGNVSVTVVFFLWVVLVYTSAEGSEELWGAALYPAMLGYLVLASFAGFQRSIVVGKEEIRKVRMLWPDSSLQNSEIRRVHFPTTQEGLWLYTDPDGNPALKIEAGLEDPVGLEELVIQSVPAAAKITGHRQEERMS
jgi:hypothetical protein